MRVEELIDWKKPYLWLIFGGTVFGWILHAALSNVAPIQPISYSMRARRVQELIPESPEEESHILDAW